MNCIVYSFNLDDKFVKQMNIMSKEIQCSGDMNMAHSIRNSLSISIQTLSSHCKNKNFPYLCEYVKEVYKVIEGKADHNTNKVIFHHIHVSFSELVHHYLSFHFLDDIRNPPRCIIFVITIELLTNLNVHSLLSNVVIFVSFSFESSLLLVFLSRTTLSNRPLFGYSHDLYLLLYYSMLLVLFSQVLTTLASSHFD